MSNTIATQLALMRPAGGDTDARGKPNEREKGNWGRRRAGYAGYAGYADN